MKEIQAWVTKTSVAEGPLPVPLKTGETRWRHTAEGGQGAGRGSVTMHNALDELYGPPPARNSKELLKRMGYFANSYLDGRIDGFPEALKNSIQKAGGG